jgi:integrase
VRERCRVRHLARSTEEAYVGWIRRYILFHHKRHPLEMGAAEVTAFLTHLAVEGQVAASTQNQALSGLLFLYREVLQREFGWLDDVVRAKKPKRLPVVFTPEEAMRIIQELQGVRWLMGMLLYGGGLRLMECLRLRVKDLDFERLQDVVRASRPVRPRRGPRRHQGLSKFP